MIDYCDDFYIFEDILEDTALKYNITPKEVFKRYLKLTEKKKKKWRGISVYHKSIIDEIGRMQ